MHRWTWLSIRSRWDLFFIYIYFYGIGGTRRGKHHALRHTRSTFYYLFLSWWLNSDFTSYLRQRFNPRKGVAGGFSELQHHCTRLQSMRLETEARCQQQVHYLTINLSFTAENQDLREAIDFGRLRRGSPQWSRHRLLPTGWLPFYIHSMKPISWSSSLIPIFCCILKT